MRVAANIETPPEIAARGLRMLVVPWVGRAGGWMAIAYRGEPWRPEALGFGATTEDAVRALLLEVHEHGALAL
jgi:hypothetical protein